MQAHWVVQSMALPRTQIRQSWDIFEIALMGGYRTPDEFEEAADARRALTDDEISSLGSDWKSWSDDLFDVRSVCY